MKDCWGDEEGVEAEIEITVEPDEVEIDVPPLIISDPGSSFIRAKSDAVVGAIVKRQETSTSVIDNPFAALPPSASQHHQPQEVAQCSTALPTNLQLDATSFRRMGSALLSFQAICTLGLSLYAWRIDNGLLELPFTWVCQLWFLVSCWKSTLPHRQNCWIYRVSTLFTLLSWNTLFLNSQLPNRSRHGMAFIARGLFLVVLVGFFEVTGHCLRQQQQQQQQQEQRNNHRVLNDNNDNINTTKILSNL